MHSDYFLVEDGVTLSVVVPFLNEGEALPSCHARLLKVLRPLGISFEIVYVDDGSTDGSCEVINAFIDAAHDKVTLVKLSRNFGKEAAMTAGIEHTVGAAVIVLDADLQDPPELIPEMVRAWKTGADVVCMKRRSRAGESRMQRATAYLYYRLLSRLSDSAIPEDTGDFRLMSRKAVDSLLMLTERSRYMKGLYAWIGLPTTVILYDRSPRIAGRTKWNYLKRCGLAIEGITSFSTEPLRWATGVGAVAALIGAGWGAIIVAKALLFGDNVPGYPSLVALMSFLGGVQLITIGVLGEYVGKSFIESKQRPLYLLQDVVKRRERVPTAGAELNKERRLVHAIR